MPIIAPSGLPALKHLDPTQVIGEEWRNSMTDAGDILHIGILNLMPVKESTEEDLLRVLASSQHVVKVDFIETASYRGAHTSREHMEAFYKPWPAVRENRYDGFIITGAPVEHLDFEDVAYWEEMTRIMDWCASHSRSTLFICWAALAGLYYYYGVPKKMLSEKISGVFAHSLCAPANALVKGLNDGFCVPHSRFSEIHKEDVAKVKELTVVSESAAAGIHCVTNADNSYIFITGHSEYSPGTLDNEYRRDEAKGMNPHVPENYYRNDNPAEDVVAQWSSEAGIIYGNWLDIIAANKHR